MGSDPRGGPRRPPVGQQRLQWRVPQRLADAAGIGHGDLEGVAVTGPAHGRHARGWRRSGPAGGPIQPSRARVAATERARADGPLGLRCRVSVRPLPAATAAPTQRGRSGARDNSTATRCRDMAAERRSSADHDGERQTMPAALRAVVSHLPCAFLVPAERCSPAEVEAQNSIRGGAEALAEFQWTPRCLRSCVCPAFEPPCSPLLHFAFTLATRTRPSSPLGLVAKANCSRLQLAASPSGRSPSCEAWFGDDFTAPPDEQLLAGLLSEPARCSVEHAGADANNRHFSTTLQADWQRAPGPQGAGRTRSSHLRAISVTLHNAELIATRRPCQPRDRH